jgi:predicted dehydrogenase
MMTRRAFLGCSAGLPALASPRAWGANERLRVAVMGTSRSNSGRNPGRGAELAIALAKIPGAEVAAVCDVDRRHLEAAAADVAKVQERGPLAVKDFRRLLDDPSVDALVIAAPDHWHAPAALLALEAGKHVYVEKPCSHNGREGELLAAAALRTGKRVQHGTQRRSWPGHREAVAALRQGVIGRVLQARSFYLFNDRKSIGRGRQVPVPDHLDWDLWQGPAPERPFVDNVVHYQWHWFWHWGTSELGNNGVHMLDVCRWGLGVDVPVQVSSVGSRLRYDDDQETPDTNLATFRFGDGRMISWEGRSWGGRTPADPAPQAVFHGESGTLAIEGTRWTAWDSAGQVAAKGGCPGGNEGHLRNFLEGIRGKETLNADIGEGWKSTRLCHLGNLSCRTGRTLKVDPATGRVLGDPEAESLWTRTYRTGWAPRG